MVGRSSTVRPSDGALVLREHDTLGVMFTASGRPELPVIVAVPTSTSGHPFDSVNVTLDAAQVSALRAWLEHIPC